MDWLKKHIWTVLLVLLAGYLVFDHFYRKPRFVQGEQAPELVLTLADGRPFRLSDLRGDYVLIDFWGSWCPPCRKANPGLVRIHREFGGPAPEGSPGFHILSAAIETDSAAWARAVAKDGLDWPLHTVDTERFSGALAQAYGVREIPTTYLLDPEGTIIGVNLDEDHLRKTLRERLGRN
jgi:thiol-disulfide isomerase/thioredoxin